jgi:transcriptional regulator with PAS, ATPase and Fis domain
LILEREEEMGRAVSVAGAALSSDLARVVAAARLAEPVASREDLRARLEPALDFARRAAGAAAAVLCAGYEDPPEILGESGHVTDALREAARRAARDGSAPEGTQALLLHTNGTRLGAVLLWPRSRPEECAMAAADIASAVIEAARAAERERDLVSRLERSEQERCREREELHRALETSRRELASKYNYSTIVGRSKAMRALFSILDKVTETHVAVLVQGESGTGKELVARAIHFNGPRRERPFLSINCAALPETLLEAELFGYLKGAFTGAERDKIGLFEAAHRGTLFLDEVSEMSASMQVKLLRVLQEQELRPVGGKDVRKIDVRIISASNQDLRSLVEAGRFRKDLFYRLNVVEIVLPPLRERREDIPLLVEHFLETIEGGREKKLGPGVMELLQSYGWPGNVRELENEIRRAIALSGATIQANDFSGHVKRPNVERYDIGHPEGLTLKQRMEILERRILQEALARANNNKTRCARELGLSRFGFLKKLDKYGLR